MSEYIPDERCLLGNCQFCGQKEDCVLLAILRKVDSLESLMEKVTMQSV